MFGTSIFVRDDDGAVFHSANVVEFRDGLIRKETRIYGEPFEAPGWRAQWARKIETPIS